MTIKVKNSQQVYKYSLGYSQLLIRGTTLRSTHWVYGIVVHTGKDTKVCRHQGELKVHSRAGPSSFLDLAT